MCYFCNKIKEIQFETDLIQMLVDNDIEFDDNYLRIEL
jgi:hypothetical protein